MKCNSKNGRLIINSKDTSIEVNVGEKGTGNNLSIPIDYIITQRKKIIPIILSKLNLNKTVFARNCKVEKITKQIAEDFFNEYHFFGSTTSAYNYGLFYKDELIGAASFSKGRKMNRLPEGKQSFELIRFCCKRGITITGGLSKLMKHFFEEKKAGDIMTYVDKQFSNGGSFAKAGFKKHSETPPLSFLVNKKTFERITFKENFDEKQFYKTQNAGNIKMIYKPNEK
ncbi:MAG: hypothetical protein JNJ40_05145 [Bacteroidia bacterium]|nr:hypothetical protein [Bacteroidia bacterium]